MSRKLVIVIVIMLSLMASYFIPTNDDNNKSIVHQHLTYPKEHAKEAKLVGNELTSHLPIFVIDTHKQGIPGMDRLSDLKLLCDYKIVANDDGLNHSTDPGKYSGKLAISLRGNSSLRFPKKQFSLKLVDENKASKDVGLLGMPKHSAWVLNGSYIDKSLIRNYMLYNISSEIMDYAPRVRLCEVMMVDTTGKLDYLGVYTLIEKPRVDKRRLKLTAYNPKHKETSFLVQAGLNIQNHKIDHLKQDDAILTYFDLEYPNVDEITEESLDYIQNEVIRFEKMLYDGETLGEWEKVNKMIDDSFVDYFIINEFFQNYDTGRLSTYMYKNVGGKFSMGPVWDFDASMNNFINFFIGFDEMKITKQFYYKSLIQNPIFVDKCCKRYRELRKTYLSEDYLLSYIDETVNYLGTAPQREANRWYNGNISLFNQDIIKMKQYVVNRGRWLDQHFAESLNVINWKGEE